MVQRNLSILVLCLFCFLGCADLTPNKAACDAERRCGLDGEAVCGVDGETYPCAAFAACTGVDIDPTGDACLATCQDPSPCSNVRCPAGTEPTVEQVDGCNVCECKSVPDCPNIACLADCEHGYVVDENGCQTCECKEPPACPGVNCRLFCEYGYAVDEDGCEICECRPEPICPDLACDDVWCPFGYEVDERGCETCECRQGPNQCEPLDILNVCPNGRVVDEDGCPTESCFEACEEIPLCDLGCPSGVERVYSDLGCELCVCRERCPPGQCEIECEFGQRVDANGCEMCECNPAPCAEHADCPTGSICANPARCDGQSCYGVCEERPRCINDNDCGPDDSCVYLEMHSCCPPGTDCLPTCQNVCLPRLVPPPRG